MQRAGSRASTPRLGAVAVMPCTGWVQRQVQGPQVGRARPSSRREERQGIQRRQGGRRRQGSHTFKIRFVDTSSCGSGDDVASRDVTSDSSVATAALSRGNRTRSPKATAAPKTTTLVSITGFFNLATAQSQRLSHYTRFIQESSPQKQPDSLVFISCKKRRGTSTRSRWMPTH